MTKLRTVIRDGLEFIVPTWDSTPVSWNSNGSWAKDPALEARVVREIRAAIPNYVELITEAANFTDYTGAPCPTFWGSHGCARELGHSGLCVCGSPYEGLCSAGLKYGDSGTLILWWWVDDRFELSFHYWRWYP